MHNRRLELGCRAIQNRPVLGKRLPVTLPLWRIPRQPLFHQIPIGKERLLARIMAKEAAKKQAREAQELLEWRQKAAVYFEHLPNPERKKRRDVPEDRFAETHLFMLRFKKPQP